jgi:hypothetical protein
MTMSLSPRTAWTLLLLVAASGVTLSDAEAATIDNTYFVSGNVPTNPMGGDYLSFWGSYGGGIPGSAWNQSPVLLGWFNHISPDPNSYPGGIFPDTVYKDAPFTITLIPTGVAPSVVPGYQYTVTGPADDGMVIHGVINGVISSTGPSNLVATFQSITPFDIAEYFSHLQGVSYNVDPSLQNPLPIGQIVLPSSLDLSLNGDTDVYASIVPEPATILAFVPLGIALIARRRARG